MNRITNAFEKAILNLIGYEPVEIVKCKYCKYASTNLLSDILGTALCTYWTDKAAGVQMVVHQDDFCSYGIKKGDRINELDCRN